MSTFATTQTIASEVTCKQVIAACDKAIERKNEVIRLSDEMLGIRKEQVDLLHKENAAKDVQITLWKNITISIGVFGLFVAGSTILKNQ